MDPRIMTQNEEMPVVVVISGVMSLCVLVATTLWMCWKIGRATKSEMEETRDEDESTGPGNVQLNTTPKETAPLQERCSLEKQDEEGPAVEDSNGDS